MGTIPTRELLEKWTLKTLTPEMAIGHLLQHAELLWAEIVAIRKRLTELTNALTGLHQNQDRLRADVDRLLQHAGLPPSDPDAPPRPKRGRPPMT